MFEDVDQMEREIETFRKNIVASSELVESISRLTEATRQQQESFSISANELIMKLDSCITEIKSDHESALQTLSRNNNALIKELQEKEAADLQDRIAEIEKISSSIKACQTETITKLEENLRQLSEENSSMIASMKTELDRQQSSFSEKLLHTEQVIGNCNTETITKAEENLRQLSEENSNMIESMKTELDAQQSAFGEKLLHTEQAIGSCKTETITKASEQLRLLSAESNRSISELKTELASQQFAFSERLRYTEQTMNGYQTNASQMYNEFIHRLETTNVDQVFKEVQALKQSFNTKFLIMAVGIIVTLAISVLNIFLK